MRAFEIWIGIGIVLFVVTVASVFYIESVGNPKSEPPTEYRKEPCGTGYLDWKVINNAWQTHDCVVYYTNEREQSKLHRDCQTAW